MRLREILEDIQVYKKGDKHLHPEFEKTFSNFLVTRYVSMMDDCDQLIYFCNKYQSVWSSRQMYQFLVQSVPRQSRYYINYVAKTEVTK